MDEKKASTDDSLVSWNTIELNGKKELQGPLYQYSNRKVHASDYLIHITVIQGLVFCLLGNITTLFCSIPAVVAATKARDAEKKGDVIKMKNKALLAIVFSVLALMWWAVSLCIFAVIVVVLAEKNQFIHDFLFGQ